MAVSFGVTAYLFKEIRLMQKELTAAAKQYADDLKAAHDKNGADKQSLNDRILENSKAVTQVITVNNENQKRILDVLKEFES
jgi:hypothetical protein